MANEIVTEIILDLDKLRASLKKAEEESKKGGQGFGEGFGEGVEQGFGQTAKKISGAFFAVTAGVTAAVGAIAAAIKASQIAEEAQRIDQQFEILTERSGIIGSELSAALTKSAAGLVDNTELLSAANRAMVDLGSSAQNLPQFLDIARKTTAVFGGDLISNLDRINLAIATGNTRSIRNIGLIIDQKDAYEKYARSINVSANSLNEQGRQQAIANAILERGTEAFRGVNPELGKNTEAWQRLKASLAGATEASAKAFDSMFGKTLENAMNKTSGTLSNLSDFVLSKFGTGTEKTAASVRSLTKEIEQLETRSIPLAEKFAPGDLPVLTLRIAKLRGELAALKEEAAKPFVGPPAPSGSAISGFDPEKLAEDKNRFMQVLNQATSDRISAEQAIAIGDDDRDRINKERRLLIENEFQTRKSEIDKLARDAGLFEKEAHEKAIVEIEKKRVAQVEALHQRQIDSSRALGNAFKSGLVSAIAAGAQSIGESLIKGGKSFDKFARAVIGVIGNMAIQMGTVLIGAGIGIESLKVLGGAAAIAAGIGLVAIGGIMTALAAGGDEGGAAAGGAAETAAGLSSPAGVGAQLDTIERQEPNTQVVVNVQGNILDRRESGLAIADIINETFGSNGIVFATGAT